MCLALECVYRGSIHLTLPSPAGHRIRDFLGCTLIGQPEFAPAVSF